MGYLEMHRERERDQQVIDEVSLYGGWVVAVLVFQNPSGVGHRMDRGRQDSRGRQRLLKQQQPAQVSLRHTWNFHLSPRRPRSLLGLFWMCHVTSCFPSTGPPGVDGVARDLRGQQERSVPPGKSDLQVSWGAVRQPCAWTLPQGSRRQQLLTLAARSSRFPSSALKVRNREGEGALSPQQDHSQRNRWGKLEGLWLRLHQHLQAVGQIIPLSSSWQQLTSFTSLWIRKCFFLFWRCRSQSCSRGQEGLRALGVRVSLSLSLSLSCRLTAG